MPNWACRSWHDVRDVDELLARFVAREITSIEMSEDERRAVHQRLLQKETGMPLFDLECTHCGYKAEYLLKDNTVKLLCPVGGVEHGHMLRLPAAPSFKVTGFNQLSGYASEQVRTQQHANGIRTEVRGNFEAFDRLT